MKQNLNTIQIAKNKSKFRIRKYGTSLHFVTHIQNIDNIIIINNYYLETYTNRPK